MSRKIFLKEIEEQTAWCPFSRYMYTDPATGSSELSSLNREFEPEDGSIQFPKPCACIGEGCAKWQHSITDQHSTEDYGFCEA